MPAQESKTEIRVESIVQKRDGKSIIFELPSGISGAQRWTVARETLPSIMAPPIRYNNLGADFLLDRPRLP